MNVCVSAYAHYIRKRKELIFFLFLTNLKLDIHLKARSILNSALLRILKYIIQAFFSKHKSTMLAYILI